MTSETRTYRHLWNTETTIVPNPFPISNRGQNGLLAVCSGGMIITSPSPSILLTRKCITYTNSTGWFSLKSYSLTLPLTLSLSLSLSLPRLQLPWESTHQNQYSEKHGTTFNIIISLLLYLSLYTKKRGKKQKRRVQ